MTNFYSGPGRVDGEIFVEIYNDIYTSGLYPTWIFWLALLVFVWFQLSRETVL